MNKRGEIFLLSMILLGIISVSIAFLESKVNEQTYLIDTKGHVSYNLKSTQLSCQFDQIQINSENVKFVDSLEGLKNYTKSSLCP